jgi:signal transduction histidine kinase/ActR/RegA family two-component response regulator
MRHGGQLARAIDNRAVVLAALAVSAVLLSLLAADLVRARYHALESARRAAATAASVVAEHVDLAVTGVDTLLLNVRHDLAVGIAPDHVLSAAAKTHPYLRSVLVADATGRIVASTESEGIGVSIADRSYFRAHAASVGGADRIRLDAPVEGRISGHVILPVSRRLETPEGAFAGVVMGVLDRDYLAVFLATQALGLSGAISLHGADGTLLAGQEPAGARIGNGSGDGGAIVASHRVGDRPQVVRVVVDRGVALAEWTSRAQVYGVLAVGLIVLLAALAGLLVLYTRRARESLQAALARAVAEKANHHKSEFLSRMSHELRTPVAAMDVIAGDLEGSPLNDEQRSQVATLRASAGYLLALVGGVLDLARVETGDLVLVDTTFSPARMLDQIERLMRPTAAAKGLSLTVDGRGLPARLQGDAVRLQQVLLNLIGNAIKYTARGGVTIGATLNGEAASTPESGGDSRPWLVFTVGDTGPGLPEGIREGRFGRVARCHPERPDSSGIGLSVARDICRAMKGSLTVVATSPAGTTFRFAVPVSPPPSPEAAGEAGTGTTTGAPAADGKAPFPAPPPPRSPATRPRGGADAPLSLLLAEDDPAQGRIFQATLGGWGHAVDLFTDGLAALEAARCGAHQALILDVHLPHMDGPEIVRCLRAEGCTVPVIGLTAAIFREDHDRYSAAGFDHLLTKPVRWDDLRSLLSAVTPSPTPPESATPGPPVQ